MIGWIILAWLIVIATFHITRWCLHRRRMKTWHRKADAESPKMIRRIREGDPTTAIHRYRVLQQSKPDRFNL